jgi:hypothetical protein
MSFVLISHRGVDKPRIRPLVEMLIEQRIPVWIDRPEEFNNASWQSNLEQGELLSGIKPGVEWPNSVESALFSASAVVVCWSKEWSNDRAMLIREFSVAHARSRTGLGVYLPLQLDLSPDIPDSVQEIRRQVHDTVQGYNFAKEGNRAFERLSKDLGELFRHASPVARQAGIGTPPGSMLTLFMSGAREAIPIIELLSELPEGPAVPYHVIPFSIKMQIANSLGQTEAASTVGQASSLVLETYPAALRRRPYTIAVMPAMLPSPLSPPIDYWESAFTNAAVLGPRMVAALLFSVRPSVLRGLEKEIERVLSRLGENDDNR